MPADLIIPASITMGLLSYALIASWYVWPHLRSLPLDRALAPILLLHSFRYVGLAFLVSGVTAVPLDPRFADPAAYGDLLAAVLALLALFALRYRWPGGLTLVWTFNVVGAVDLLNALTQGLRHTASGDLGATFFVPTVIVPALLVTHVMVFVLLLRRTPAALDGAVGGRP